MNPTTQPNLQDASLLESVARKAETLAIRLGQIADEWRPAVFASSLGAEDMVITDAIVRKHLPIEIFSLDTGRLPAETYDLMHEVQRLCDQVLVMAQGRAAAQGTVAELCALSGETDFERCFVRLAFGDAALASHAQP